MCDSCASPAADAAPADETPAAHTADYTVTGMTCDHCAGSVGTEIGRIPQVTGVSVDLPTGTVTVSSTAPVPAEAVAAAVTEAGYALAG